MKIKKITFDKPCHCVVNTADFDPTLRSDEVLIRTACTLVSAGTELAIYRGTEGWAPLPFTPGYASVGYIEAVGGEVSDFKAGDCVLSYSAHAEYVKVSTRDILVKVDPARPLERTVFTRLAAVAITALRISSLELGDRALVCGTGLIGNLAAQLIGLAGVDVLLSDISERRLAIAAECGLTNGVNPSCRDLKEYVLAMTGGAGVNTVVDATGSPQVIGGTLELLDKHGEVILLGSPRERYTADVTAIYERIHLWGYGCPTLKGAHEWQFPLKSGEHQKQSLERNCRILAGLIEKEKLAIQPLISHVAEPEAAPAIYQELFERNENYYGVVFKWN